MDRAIGLWKWFPRQIRADLRAHYHGVDIGQWHRGEMNSAELIDLLEELPDASRYKGALRGYPYGVKYEWADEEYRQARIAKELAAAHSADGDLTMGRDYTAIFSPVERLVIEAQKKAMATNVSGARAVANAGLYRNNPERR